MSFDLRNELESAIREHTGFAGLEGPGREASASAFRARVARLEMIGPRARDALEQQLESADPIRLDAAARALAGMTDPDAAARLAAAFLRHGRPGTGDRPQLSARHLARLGKAAPLPPGVLPPLDRVRPFERAALVRALFRRPSAEARRLIDPIFGGLESTLAEAALDGMAAWDDLSVLRDVMSRPPMAAPRSLPRAFHPVDVRPHAALHLALAGAPDGLEALRGWAADRGAPHAAQAALRLAWLAHPDGVAATARLLRARGEALDLALDAASIYRTPLLAEALLSLAQRATRSSAWTRVSPGADALRALSEMAEAPPPLGAPLPRPEEPATSRLRARLRAEALDPALRFSSGAPLTLSVLAEELASVHAAVRTAAAHNLRAITGEDHGFDVEDDLAGNLAAIEAWRTRARDLAPIGRGGWAYAGAPLPPPERPSIF